MDVLDEAGLAARFLNPLGRRLRQPEGVKWKFNSEGNSDSRRHQCSPIVLRLTL
jgi:hypothetical protein